ncbi:uncharacterized protein LOC126733440 [Anthonomus grandis grandis]|uniref:uncharacterized protein LOC126733440 n=1 Tax=Anthonomus grandis grandis TaxID=2921223 RepID=UPI00216533FC|nr:uncharacterized protein LOC126733440 [Anthonomus grandis grandis]
MSLKGAPEVVRFVILEDTLNNSHDEKKTVIGVSVGVAVAVLVVLLLLCLCKNRRKKRLQSSLNHTSVVTTTTSSIMKPCVYDISTEIKLRCPEDVARRYERSVSNLSTKSQIYLVPFDVLPADFDYSSREVDVRGDYVILKNLSLIERQGQYQGTINEGYEYEQQSAYNPLYVISPSREVYKKQESYNTDYFY